MKSRWNRSRRWLIPTQALFLAMSACALLLPACASWDGHFDIFGYTTQPNYDLRFKTISVLVFKNKTPQNLTPVPGLEMDLTKAVVREIEWKTPYKVISCDGETELRGTIVSFSKSLLNYTPFNTVREAETVMTVELIWRNRLTGELLTKPTRRPGGAREPELREPILAPGSILPPGTRPIGIPGTPIPETSGGIAASGEIEEEIIDPFTPRKQSRSSSVPWLTSARNWVNR